MSAPTKVYLFRNEMWRDNEGWMAMAENGVVVCSHISSSRGWGLHDVSPQMHHQAYVDAFGDDYEVELIEVPDGKLPPAEVVERNQLLAALDMSAEVSS